MKKHLKAERPRDTKKKIRKGGAQKGWCGLDVLIKGEGGHEIRWEHEVGKKGGASTLRKCAGNQDM